MSLTPLPPTSAEYGLAEHLLQIQLNAPQLQITEAFNVANPGAGSHFSLFCKAVPRPNVVTVFVPASQIAQSPEDIALRGLRVDARTGLTITPGAVSLNRSSASLEVLQLKVALGNTLNHWPGTLDPDPQFIQSRPARRMLRPGYHSFCISASECIVFDRSQVHCTALVRFAGGANAAEPSGADALCAACGASEATVYCATGGAQLCADCDAAAHADHERCSLADGRLQNEFCPFHPRKRVAFYCPECRCAVCRHCKVKGAHTDAAGHLLVPIRRAYKRALRATKRTDPVIAARRALIAERRALCEAVVSELAANQERLELEIARLVEEAIEQERLIAGEKALVVKSVQAELSRKLAEMAALERSFADLRRVSGPLAFLRAANAQAEILAAMQGTTDLPLDLSLQGDLIIYGSKSSGRAFVKANRQRLGQIQRVLGEDDASHLTRWVAAFVPRFGDLCTDFEDGVALVQLLQELRPGEEPALPFDPLPETAAQKQAARRAAVAFARELGVTGDFNEETLCVRDRDATRIVALLRAVQRDLGGSSGRSSRSPRASPRPQSREGSPSRPGAGSGLAGDGWS
jgi:hypothetical protein